MQFMLPKGSGYPPPWVRCAANCDWHCVMRKQEFNIQVVHDKLHERTSLLSA